MKKLFRKLTARMLVGAVLALGGLFCTGCQTSGYDQIKFTAVEGEEELTGSPGSLGTVILGEASSPRVGDAARLEKDDLVRVTFSGIEPPIQTHEERIKVDGTITLPLILAVKAEGKSIGQLQKEITEKYVPEYYKRLIVTVSTERRVYYVGGQVKGPGRQEYIGTITVTKAIQSAGDFTDFAAKTRVELTRADGRKVTVNCNKAAKDPSLDPPVYPGDKINVPLRGWRDIFR